MSTHWQHIREVKPSTAIIAIFGGFGQMKLTSGRYSVFEGTKRRLTE